MKVWHPHSPWACQVFPKPGPGSPGHPGDESHGGMEECLGGCEREHSVEFPRQMASQPRSSTGSVFPVWLSCGPPALQSRLFPSESEVRSRDREMSSQLLPCPQLTHVLH